MLRVSMIFARPGMVLGLPVYHPLNHDTLLLRAGIALEKSAILRLRELGQPEVWIRYPKLEQISKYMHPRVYAARAGLTRQIADAFDMASEQMHATLDFRRYRHAVTSLLASLGDNPQSAVFVNELVENGQPAVRHATNVSYLSMLIGLRLYWYLERERPKLPPPLARDVTSLGVAAMLHDIGMTRLPPEMLNRWAETQDEEDEQWRSHVQIGYDLVHGEIEPTAAAAVLHHHQKFDGTGFPSRTTLNGDEVTPSGSKIHIFARIIGAANLFDRLVHPAHTPGSDEVGLASRPVVTALRMMLGEPYRSWVDPVLFGGVLEVCPPYAPGTIVRLSSGTRGVVIDWRANDPCRPKILVMGDDEDDFEIDDDARTIDLFGRTDIEVASVGGVDVLKDNFYPDGPLDDAADEGDEGEDALAA